MTDEAAAAPEAPDPKDTRIGELSKESAGYRRQRNDALRRATAFETMLKAHGVDTSGVTSEKLRELPVKDGRVDGVFEYTPPKVKTETRTDAPPRVEQPAGLTVDEVRKWAPEQINARWSEVKALLEQQGG